ncbi:MAG: DNA-directed RNA polymerase subunit omega [Candidatus Moduliflexus flocculans]|nr:DNA-directed RNA polymerase subunit omega [Candidatus Moduliflexus flocculans]
MASKRAKQLLKGAKPKIQTRSKSLIRIAQAEVREGLIEYEIIPARMDDIPEREDRVFAGAGIPAIVDEAGDSESPPARTSPTRRRRGRSKTRPRRKRRATRTPRTRTSVKDDKDE